MRQSNTTKTITLVTTILGGTTALLLIAYITLGPIPHYKDGFNNLQQLHTLAAELVETIPLQGTNTIKPDFSPYYQTLARTWKGDCKARAAHLLVLLRLLKKPYWSPTFFAQQLHTLVKQRVEKGFKESYVIKLTGKIESQFVIFGNIQGAFHSLVRDLEKLKELGVIDDNLVVKENNFLIFMGNIVSRSPLTMETLSLVMRLVEKNPERVIYLRGDHESNNYWQEHTLKTELQTRASFLDPTAQIPLEKEVNQFFNTLALGCYITMPSQTNNEFIRISYQGRTQNEWLQENAYASFLNQQSGPFAIHQLTEKPSANLPDAQIKIRVIFKGEKKRETYQEMPGLRLLSPDLDSVAWNVLSCPTVVYQQALKFFNDAFVLLTPHADPDHWKIMLYNRDVRTKDQFKTTTFMLTSGLAEGAIPPTAAPPPMPAQAATAPPQPTPSTPKSMPAPTPTPAVTPSSPPAMSASTQLAITPTSIAITPTSIAITPTSIATTPAPMSPPTTAPQTAIPGPTPRPTPSKSTKDHVDQILHHAQEIEVHAKELLSLEVKKGSP